MKNFDIIIEKYLAAETTLEEEKSLKAYFSGGDIADEHRYLAPLFAVLEEESKMTSEVDVAAVIKAAAAEENQLSVHRSSRDAVSRRSIHLSKYIPALAAVMVAVFAAVFLMNRPESLPFTESENVVVLDDEKDTEEAIEVTRKALSLLSQNYNKGAQAVQEIKHMEKTQIFK